MERSTVYTTLWCHGFLTYLLCLLMCAQVSIRIWLWYSLTLIHINTFHYPCLWWKIYCIATDFFALVKDLIKCSYILHALRYLYNSAVIAWTQHIHTSTTRRVRAHMYQTCCWRSNVLFLNINKTNGVTEEHNISCWLDHMVYINV